MENLLKEKLQLVKELKNFSQEILNVSLKTDYEKLNIMIDDRKNYFEKIDRVNFKIKELEDNNFSYSNSIKSLKKEIQLLFKEITDIDNLIRKNIHNELINIKSALNQPNLSSTSINIKA